MEASMDTKIPIKGLFIGTFPDCEGKRCKKVEYQVVNIVPGDFRAEISFQLNQDDVFEGNLQQNPGASPFLQTLYRILSNWFRNSVNATFVSRITGCESDCVCGGYIFGEWFEGRTEHTHQQLGVFIQSNTAFRVNALISGTVSYRRRFGIGECNPLKSSSSSTSLAVEQIDALPGKYKKIT
jgi:hypothetical protein